MHLASTADWRLQAVCSLIISLKKTLVFAQRDDCGLTHEQQLKVNHDEVSHYKAMMDEKPYPVSDCRGNRTE